MKAVMWFSALGSMLIMLAGAMSGFWYAARCRQRVDETQLLIKGLSELQSYIVYLQMPLPQALHATAGHLQGVLGELFVAWANALENGQGRSVQEALIYAWRLCHPQLALQQPEYQTLLFLSATLGSTDAKEQLRLLVLVIQELQALAAQTAAAYSKDARMYRYLGICGSLALVIILL